MSGRVRRRKSGRFRPALRALPASLAPLPRQGRASAELIPCPGYTDVSGLNIYYYDGNNWILIMDGTGNVQPGGIGMVVPGSRVNHNGTDPPTIEIRIYHFSGFQAGSFSGGGGGGGGGCFIATASNGSSLGHLIFYALFNLALISLGIYAFDKIIGRR